MKIPDCGDHMTLDEFNRAVDTLCFVDYDGYGKLATATEMSPYIVVPSEVFTRKKRFRKKYLEKTQGFTHIVWFNK